MLFWETQIEDSLYRNTKEKFRSNSGQYCINNTQNFMTWNTTYKFCDSLNC